MSSFFLPLLLATLAAMSTMATENVYITSNYGQLVTSSTLRWKHTTHDKRFYRHPSVLKQGHYSLCRGHYQNQIVPGWTDHSGHCAVGFYEALHRMDTYEVMEDLHQSARLEWRPWDIFTKLPEGMVAYTEKDHFVARIKDERKKFRYGDLNPRRGLSGDIAVYFSEDKVKYYKKGELLVEVEPTKYLLEDIQFITRRAKVEKTQLHLGSRMLSHETLPGQDEAGDRSDRHQWAAIRSVVAYNASYYYYWGQSPGLVKALPAHGVTFTNPEKKVSFSWGLPLSYDRHRILEVSYRLQPGTSVQVQASANRTTTEVPFTAKLVTTYPDGEQRRRQINGTYLETVLDDVRTEYGRPFYTSNGAAAPTTTTTTTTAATTTTQATTTKHGRVTTLRPRRTTTPLPTRPNPLLRFYPTVDDLDEEEKEKVDRMQSDQAEEEGKATNKRSSSDPMTESLVNNSGVNVKIGAGWVLAMLIVLLVNC